MENASILIVDDDEDILETAKMFLKHEFSHVTIDSNPNSILPYISRNEVDVILLDMNFKKGVNDGEAGFYWLDRILEFDPSAVVIFITAYGEVDLAVDAIKRGATDFVLKPWKNQKLLGTILSALSHRKKNNQVAQLKENSRNLNNQINKEFTEFIGENSGIKKIKELIEKVAPTDANVLILGENGTGKEVVARMIHQYSLRKNQDFVSVDLGAVPESLFESELYGHVKGSFTDAKENKTGRFEIADKGSLFLDEIGNISLSMQAKLLSVLQNRSVRKVGGNVEKSIDIRLISATNSPIHRLVEENKFRQDLLYRLNTVELKLPPLRERIDDIPLLAKHFVLKYAEKYRRNLSGLNESALLKLKSYHWPGNIRELQHAMERAVILGSDKIITTNDILLEKATSDTLGMKLTLDEMEKLFIIQSLQSNDMNVTKTAKILGLTRTALYRRINKYGINTN